MEFERELEGHSGEERRNGLPDDSRFLFPVDIARRNQESMEAVMSTGPMGVRGDWGGGAHV